MLGSSPVSTSESFKIFRVFWESNLSFVKPCCFKINVQRHRGNFGWLCYSCLAVSLAELSPQSLICISKINQPVYLVFIVLQHSLCFQEGTVFILLLPGKSLLSLLLMLGVIYGMPSKDLGFCEAPLGFLSKCSAVKSLLIIMMKYASGGCRWD